MSKLLVVGAAGRTGRHVVDLAVARGDTVTALARARHDPAGFPDGTHFVAGDAADPGVLADAVAGQDAVVLAVGTSAIVRALLPAMREAGVDRVVMTSSRSVVATRPRAVVDLVWWRFRPHYADLARAEGMLEASGTRWTVVRAVMLDDRAPTGLVHSDFATDATGGDWRLSRRDYAATLLDAVADESLAGRAVGVGNEKRARR